MLAGGIEQVNTIRKMFPAGPPELPPEYDVWLYEAVENEDAGLERSPVKPRHYATVFDDRVLVFLMFRKAISTMRILEQEPTGGDKKKIDKKPILKEVMAMGEEMTRLVPNSHMGWHCRGWAADEFGAMAKGYDAAIKVTAEDDAQHKVMFLYRYIDCIMRRGHFRMGDIRKLYADARKLEKQIRPLGLGMNSSEKARVKHIIKSTPPSRDHQVCKKGLVNVSYSSEEEYQRKVAELEKEAQQRGRSLIMHKDIPRAPEEYICSACEGKFRKVLRCSRCKSTKYVGFHYIVRVYIQWRVCACVCQCRDVCIQRQEC
jgi:hypothetical protein